MGSFWWPGFLITRTLISAALGGRRREAKPWTPRRALDRDHVNRPATVLGLRRDPATRGAGVTRQAV
ncbi:hypothetical protein [Catellatospora citrea]|uniref:Uncharacterized protein n=1 Tax=Catellatospora citrea TaxID=53366 RepID=A0A8J3NXZ7_9ACTN|nr:hypothetical protein [Catellatospora citrea]GIF96970.1 hypothetical protein Cci01nite_20640 [Catellatospora citrea]